jgi:hypothetical protein
LRGKLVVVAPADDPEADADPDVDGEPLLDGELLQALATASVSTATAAVPNLAVRHRLFVNPFVGLTCSYLLTSKSFDNPGQGAAAGKRR